MLTIKAFFRSDNQLSKEIISEVVQDENGNLSALPMLEVLEQENAIVKSLNKGDSLIEFP